MMTTTATTTGGGTMATATTNGRTETLPAEATMTAGEDDRRPRLALSLPNLADPATLIDLGVRAEHAGWDGVFFWDHAHGSPSMPAPAADPWVLLGALAVQTERIRIGTNITAAARRRPQKLARETVTVDHLSNGRMIFGVGLGEPPEEYTAYGDDASRREIGERLDETLEVLELMWSGKPFDHEGTHHIVRDAQFLPTPVQEPRIPVWTACMVPNTTPLQRAARWDGVALASIGETGDILAVTPDEVRTAVDVIDELRDPVAGPYDVAVSAPGVPAHDELEELAAAGATWVLVSRWVDELDSLVDLASSGLD
jgi:alkanesulfonate monooxygenase SsuD/methylene tetrahydromethanopterin reductase-like flavin-dependent oxidoreductase (luciferase family)